jgi:hypothetical protein
MFVMRVLKYLRTAVTLAAGGMVLASCHEALNVTNPAVIPESSLNDALLVNVLLNSSVAQVTRIYDDLAFFSAILTDEGLNATNDYRSGEISQRIVELANADVGPYQELAQNRAVSDSIASRLKVLVKTPGTDLRLARALALAGYGYIFAAEFLCSAPINAGPMLQDDSLFKLGIDRFKQAITIATAADTGSTKTVADSILNLSRIGAGRAELGLGNKSDALTFASAVTDPNFHWDLQYLNVNTPVNLTNSVWGHNSSGATLQLGVHPLMQNLNDPRVAYVTPPPGKICPLGHNQLSQICVPYGPIGYSGFVYPTATTSSNWSASGDTIGPATNIQLASGLEAQYIVAEAQGPTAATVSFVNVRRAFGKENPLGSGDDVMAALREERRRDFFLRATRLGDLRRYKGGRYPGDAAGGVGDFFPSGTHPNAQWGIYGYATCYIITLAEMNANPNVAGYTPPQTRPPGVITDRRPAGGGYSP